MGRTALAAIVSVAVGLIAISISLADLRWTLVAMMMIFIALPMAMTLVYLSLSLSPEATLSTLPHTVEFTESGDIVIEYLDDKEVDSQPNSNDNNRSVRKEIISSTEIEDTRLTSPLIILTLKSSRMIIVPIHALPPGSILAPAISH
ncbi:MAG: hypothetical protein NC342_05780 [Pseudoflavonifractor sp.]|nr:hypothetical protein [Alloprevotella sp.]MCM1117026.1 hypothetical protein [Pseudoflavonifractor sp.]